MGLQPSNPERRSPELPRGALCYQYVRARYACCPQVGQDTWGRAVERAYRREDSEQWRRAMDQQYRDSINNARDTNINELCEAEAEREGKAIYDSAAEVRRCRLMYGQWC